MGAWRWAQCWAESRKIIVWVGVSDLLKRLDEAGL